MEGTEKWPKSANIASAPETKVPRNHINVVRRTRKIITFNKIRQKDLPVMHKTQPPRDDHALKEFFLKNKYI